VISRTDAAMVMVQADAGQDRWLEAG
jgi:hypothetical protein